MMSKKILITEINRNLSLMGVNPKKLLTEQALWKFMKSIEDILTGAEDIPGSRMVKVGGELDDAGKVINKVEVPKGVFDDLRLLLDNPNYYDLMGNEAKTFFNKIISSNKKLFDAIYGDAVNDFLTRNNISKENFLQQLAKDLEDIRVTNPTASMEDVLRARGVDEATAKLLDSKLTTEAKPYLKWNIDGKIIDPKIIASWKNFWNVFEPKMIKSIRYKWLVGYTRGIAKAKQKILDEMAIIQGKLQKVEDGEPIPENIKNNLENLWFLIAGMRKSGNQSHYRGLIKKYIEDNQYLPADQLDEFMKQDFVQNSINAAAKNALEEAATIGKKSLQAFMESFPFTNFLSVLSKKGWKFKGLNLKEFAGLVSPNFKRLFNYVVARTPLTADEVAEISMRTGRNAAIAETAISWLIWENIVIPTSIAAIRTVIENWFLVPGVKDQIELVKQLCMYGAIKDDKGKPVDCEKYINDLEYASRADFKRFWKENLPTFEWFKEYKDELVANTTWTGALFDGTIGLALNILDSLTISDEFIESTWEDLIAPVMFRDSPAFWDKWQNSLRDRYDQAMAQTVSQLKSEGFNTENPKVFQEQLKKKIEDLKKQYPEIDKSKGDFKNTLEDFKRWLIEVNTLNKVDAEKASENKETVDGKEIKYYLGDGTKPTDETNPKWVWFPNGNFYEMGKTPINK